MSKSDQKAVALKYNAEQDLAPVVIASGYGPIAEKIIDIAEQRGVPIYRDDSATSLLCMLEVGATIPEELYQVVAAIYGHILLTAAKLKGQSMEELISGPASAQEEAPHDREASGEGSAGGS